VNFQIVCRKAVAHNTARIAFLVVIYTVGEIVPPSTMCAKLKLNLLETARRMGALIPDPRFRELRLVTPLVSLLARETSVIQTLAPYEVQKCDRCRIAQL